MIINIENKSLEQNNSMRINTICKNFFVPDNYDKLINIIENNITKEVIILGKGSNIIFAKNYYNDDYIFISTQLLNKIDFNRNIIIAECGVSLHDLAWYALEKQSKGFEFLEDIPGSVGGGVYINAGTHAGTISNLINKVVWYNPKTSKIETSYKDQIYFSYRKSMFLESNGIILSCYFNTEQGEYKTILNNMLETKKKRYLKQPRDYPSAGSVFKRPSKDGVEYYIWKLLDGVNLRGYSINGAIISKKHPGFIVNKGGCTGCDILELMQLCKDKVFQEYDIILETEWTIV